jgi:hypothetical protein
MQGVKEGWSRVVTIIQTALPSVLQVFMLSSEQKLDDATVSAIMASKPFSRLPVGACLVSLLALQGSAQMPAAVAHAPCAEALAPSSNPDFECLQVYRGNNKQDIVGGLIGE